MATKHSLKMWLIDALRDSGGAIHHVRVAEHIWKNHETELKASGDLLYTWQYELRWAANNLRTEGILARVEGSGRGDGVWRLAGRQD